EAATRNGHIQPSVDPGPAITEAGLRAIGLEQKAPPSSSALAAMDDFATTEMQRFAKNVLGLTDEQVAAMAPEDLKALVKANGFDIGIIDQLDSLSEAEAAKLLANKMAENDKEIKRLTREFLRPDLTPEEREKIGAELAKAQANARLYNGLMERLLDN